MDPALLETLITHEHPLLLGLLPSSQLPQRGWPQGENQASGAAACPFTGPGEDDPSSASQLPLPHCAAPPLTADAEFPLCLWFLSLTPIHRDPRGPFALGVNSSILNDEPKFASIFKNIYICKNNVCE